MISRLRLFIIRPRTPEKKIKVEIKIKISNEKNMLKKLKPTVTGKDSVLVGKFMDIFCYFYTLTLTL